jgi:hypothetical protein
MFASQSHRLDFADTRTAGTDPLRALTSFGRLDPLDPVEQMAQADAADRHLLNLVLCVAGATLLLAVAASFM